jgi:hypothetical protein
MSQPGYAAPPTDRGAGNEARSTVHGPLKRRGPSKYNYRTKHGKSIVDRIFANFPYWTRGDPVKIYNTLGVPLRTSFGWYRHWLKDSVWRPYRPHLNLRCRMFTDDQEAELAKRIRDDYLSTGHIFTNADFRVLAIDAYYQWNPIDSEAEIPAFKQFMCSNGFVNLFKKRHRFSSRRSHFKRRSPPNPELEKQFVSEIIELVNRQDRDLVLNCDESSWKLYPNGILTWAETGSQNVAIPVTGNEKDAITVMATISFGGKKLPLYILAKGKTARCEASQLGELGEHVCDHSPTGWMTENTMVRYLGWLREELNRIRGGEETYDLIMDIYPVHVMESVRLQARLLGFRVHFIPSGLTDQYQPLDRSVFGCLKSTARAEYLKLVREEPLRKIAREDAVIILRRSWDKLSSAALEEAWSIYEADESVARAPEPGRRSASGRRAAGSTSSSQPIRVLNRYQGLAVAAMGSAGTQEKPYVSLSKIMTHASEFEDRIAPAQLRKLMKQALTGLVDQKILRAKKDSFALTKRGSELLAVSHEPVTV